MDIHNLKKVFPLTVQNLFKHKQKQKTNTSESSGNRAKEKTKQTFNKSFVLRLEQERNNIQQEVCSSDFTYSTTFLIAARATVSTTPSPCAGFVRTV